MHGSYRSSGLLLAIGDSRRIRSRAGFGSTRGTSAGGLGRVRGISLRIAYAYRHFNSGSSLADVFRRRAEALSRRADVTVVTSASTRAATDAPLSFETVEPLAVGSGRLTYAVETASFAWRASRLLHRRRREFDVVTVDGFAGTSADVVVVHAVRPAEMEAHFEHAPALRRRLTPFLRPQTGVVLTVERRLFREPWPLCAVPSAAVGRDLVRTYGVPDELVEVLPYGIDVSRFQLDAAARASVRERLGTPEGALVALFVGDDFARKGLGRLIDALPRAHAGTTLWVAGGTDPAAFQSRASAAGVDDRVVFLGRVSPTQLPELYSGADVVVLPSEQDAWGIPVIEGMAAGRVVVASELTGAHEVIDQGRDGFVVRGAGTPDELAAVLSQAHDPALRATVGAAAAAKAAGFDEAPIDERFFDLHLRARDRRLAA